MEEVNKNTELDNTDKKLHISDVRNSILKRIEQHELNIKHLRIILSEQQNKNIEDSLEKVTSTIHVIREEEYRIDELNLVLKYCF